MNTAHLKGRLPGRAGRTARLDPPHSARPKMPNSAAERKSTGEIGYRRTDWPKQVTSRLR